VKRNYKNLTVIFFLGIASGMPLALILSSLKAFLLDRGFDLATIGFFTLATLPYSLKIFFAPIIDSKSLPIFTKIFGQRKSWMILTQVLLAVFIAFFSIESIATALSTALIESKWRMEIHEFSEVLLINDSYNSSPDAVEAALRTLILFAQERGGRAWAFLGKMAELGESSASAHQQVGTLAYQMGIDHLVCVDAPDYQPAQHSEGQTNLHLCDRNGARAIAEQIEPGDVILVKASRSERFEILAEEIEEVVKANILAGEVGRGEE
jgi:UDP-N-acetylmuramyl pentapeptide synthase